MDEADRSMNPSELDLEQQAADAMWTMGEREWREMYEPSDDE